MTYQVIWTKAARDQLSTIWINSAARQAVTAAAHAIDTALARDPKSVGESRPGRRRIVFSKPLVVICRVDTKTRRVVVSNCRAY